MMTILLPMAAMVFYIVGIGVATFLVRKNAVASQAVNVKYFKTYDLREGQPPEFVLRMARHYDNMMQLPLFFLVTGAVALHFGLNGWVPVSLAWAFFLSRVLHSYIHLGSNHVLKRAGSFALGWICLICLWIVILMRGVEL